MRRPRLIRVHSKPPLCVDFMGVLFVRRGASADGKLVGAVTPGAAEFLVNAADHFTVNIFSEHTATGGQRNLQMILVPALEPVLGSRNAAFEFLTTEVKWPTMRLDHFLMIDDRGFRFDGEFPDPVELLKFQPWHMRSTQ